MSQNVNINFRRKMTFFDMFLGYFDLFCRSEVEFHIFVAKICCMRTIFKRPHVKLTTLGDFMWILVTFLSKNTAFS